MRRSSRSLWRRLKTVVGFGVCLAIPAAYEYAQAAPTRGRIAKLPACRRHHRPVPADIGGGKRGTRTHLVFVVRRRQEDLHPWRRYRDVAAPVRRGKQSVLGGRKKRPMADPLRARANPPQANKPLPPAEFVPHRAQKEKIRKTALNDWRRAATNPGGSVNPPHRGYIRRKRPSTPSAHMA